VRSSGKNRVTAYIVLILCESGGDEKRHKKECIEEAQRGAPVEISSTNVAESATQSNELRQARCLSAADFTNVLQTNT